MKIYIIGAGVMGWAIANRLRAAGSKKYTVTMARRETKKNVQLGSADVVIIAVKPQDIPVLAQEVAAQLSSKTIIVSIAAGVSMKRLKQLFGQNQVVRVMPNLGVTVGQGIAGWVAASSLTRDNRGAVKGILADLIEAVEFKNEDMLNKVTTISGCGPAYFFYIAEAMVQAGIGMGLKEKVARRLVQKTLATAAAVQDEGQYPLLIGRVASKKGVTEVALRMFSEKKLNTIIRAGMRAALKRTTELSHD